MTRPKLDIDDRWFNMDTELLVTQILLAARRSVGAAARKLEQDFEKATAASVPGDLAWRAWTSRVYPKGGRPAYDPTAEIFGKGGARTQGMLQWWSEPGMVRPKRGGEYLVVPLKAALGTYVGDKILPRMWEGIYRTRLRPWFRNGKTPLLVADGVSDQHGFFIPAQKGKAMKRGGQNVSKVKTVPVFALIPEQEHGNKVSLGPLIDDAHRYLEITYDRRVGHIKIR